MLTECCVTRFMFVTVATAADVANAELMPRTLFPSALVRVVTSEEKRGDRCTVSTTEYCFAGDAIGNTTTSIYGSGQTSA